jgi:uncharacterized protein (TIGR00661 family)
MRILYGVVGEGMGHAIRSRVILDELVKKHDVQVVVSGRAHDYLSKRASEHLRVKKIWGYTIVTEDNEVKNFRTVLANLKGALTGGWPRNVQAYFDVANSFRPEVVISDFETWSYLYAVNRMLPVVSVDNMQIINRCTHPRDVIAGHEASFQIAKAVVKGKVPGAYHYLVSTFFHAPLRKQRTSLHPPILRGEVLVARRDRGGHLLVYQTYTTNQDLPRMLARLGIECRVYGLRRDLREEVRDGNLVYKPFSETGFVEDLRTCRGVVASGGFTLMGEAVFLHKPMLSEPVAKQFEQILNSRYLEREGYGLCAEHLSDEKLREFLSRLPEFEQNLSHYAQDGNTQLLAKLEDVLQRAQNGVPAEAE